MMRALMYAVLLAVSVGPTRGAQQAGLSGIWSVKAEPAKGRTADGGSWSRSAIAGSLEIAPKGNTLTGAWTGPRGEAWPCTGRLEGTRFEMITEWRDVPVTSNGRSATVRMRWIFRGSITDDKLTGTMALSREGNDSPGGEQPFKAERRR